MTSVAYSMFNGFNTNGEIKTMTGNWQEEKALKDLTGKTRSGDRNDKDGNHMRVMHHSNQELAKNYNSTYRNQFVDVFSQRNIEKFPVRKARDFAKIKEEVKKAMDETEKNRSLESQKTHFTTNTRDLMKYDPIANQEEFKYVKHFKNRALTKPKTEKRPIVFPKQSWADLYRGEAITQYSLAARRGNDSGVGFVMTPAVGVNPFGKSARFTNSEPFKAHSEGSDSKGMKPSGPGMLMHDRNALEDLRISLLGVIDRVGSKTDIINFLRRGTDGALVRFVTMEDLKTKLGDLDISISPREQLAIKRSFDYGGYDEISPNDFINCLC